MNTERSTYQGPNFSTLAMIRKETVKKGRRAMDSRLFHRKGSEDAIAGWKQELDRILHIFYVCSYSFRPA